jgi:hypothetical protein
MYTINKGINKTAEFKGVKGIFIYILLGIFFFDFMVIMVLQIAGVPGMVLYPGVIGSGIITFGVLYWFVNRFGEHGFWKFMALKRQPKKIKNDRPYIFKELVVEKGDRR